MKYFLLIVTLFLLAGSLKPSSLKIKNMKELCLQLLDNNKNKKEYVAVATIISLLLAIIYCVLLMVYVQSFVFTVVITIWLIQGFFDHNLILSYTNHNKENWFLNSTFYRIASKVIDISIYGYVVYFIMIHWQ